MDIEMKKEILKIALNSEKGREILREMLVESRSNVLKSFRDQTVEDFSDDNIQNITDTWADDVMGIIDILTKKDDEEGACNVSNASIISDLTDRWDILDL